MQFNQSQMCVSVRDPGGETWDLVLLQCLARPAHLSSVLVFVSACGGLVFCKVLCGNVCGRASVLSGVRKQKVVSQRSTDCASANGSCCSSWCTYKVTICFRCFSCREFNANIDISLMSLNMKLLPAAGQVSWTRTWLCQANSHSILYANFKVRFWDL